MRISRAQVVEGVVVVALIAGTAWLGRQVHHNFVVHGSDAAAQEVTVAPYAIPATGIAGQVADLAVRQVERPQVLLVMSTTCQFCEKNMPEWRRLAEEIRELGAPAELVVLSVSDAEETAAYLERHGLDVPVRLIDRAVLPLLGITGYPATLGVDPTSGAIAPWLGVLDDSKHQALTAWAQSRGSIGAP